MRQFALGARTRTLTNSLVLCEEYHLRYPSHGYQWLNVKIRLDTGAIMSDPYAYKPPRQWLDLDGKTEKIATMRSPRVGVMAIT